MEGTEGAKWWQIIRTGGWWVAGHCCKDDLSTNSLKMQVPVGAGMTQGATWYQITQKGGWGVVGH